MLRLLKVSLVFISLSFSVVGLAQGISFEHGSWAEVLAKAAAANKPIFVDIYTSWCGPCKQMSNNIFPQKEVGDKYNSAFICYKIDAEKGEGIELAKTYGVKSYPTFLYLKPNGELAYKVMGSKVIHEFIAEADIALQKAGLGKTEKSLDEYKKEYDGGNRNPDFLLAYMKQRYMNKQPNVELGDTLFKYLPTEQRLNTPYVEQLVFNARNFYSPLYNFIINNYVAVKKAVNPAMHDLMDARIRVAADVAIRSYKGKPDSAIPERLTKVYTGVFADLTASKEEPLYLMLAIYYNNAADTVGYLANAAMYANQILLQQTDKSLRDSARLTMEDTQRRLNAGEIDSAYYTGMLARSEAFLRQSAFRSANLAVGIAERAQTKQQLELALKLATHSISLDATPNNQAAYAFVLSKFGKQKEAKKIVQKALDEATAKNDRNLPAIKKSYDFIMGTEK